VSPTVIYFVHTDLSFCFRPKRCDFHYISAEGTRDQVREFERSVFERSEVKQYNIGILLGLGDEFKQREVFERSEFERTKFNCITVDN
jgi:hypothetical protein